MSFGNTVKDGSGTAYWLLVNALGQLIIDAGWTPELQAEEAINDSDKSLTVPANEEWIVKSIWIELITTATAGNRQLAVEIQDDAADVIAQYRLGIVQAASLTRYYQLAPQLINMTAFIDTDFLTMPIPEIYLPASYVIRIWDNKAIAAAADDMVIQMLISKRSVP